MYLPDGLLTSGFLKHDVEPDPHIIAPDPFASDDCLNDFSPVHQFPPLEPEELNTMNPSEDEPSSGLNGRLRPRKSAVTSPLSIQQIVNKFDGKQTQEKLKRSSPPSKAPPSKPEDFSNISNLLLTPQILCPYCDRKFGSKQNVSKHIRRFHLSPSKIDSAIFCLFCNHVETEPNDIIRHMVDSHPNQYFACLDCHTRFPSTKELAEHKLNICEKQKIPYRSNLRRKSGKKSQKILDSDDKGSYSGKKFSTHGFNGIVISCELKPAHIHDDADIEDNITTNLILPPSKNISPAAVLEKNAVIVLDDIQWNRRIPSNFSFHNTDADQILSRLGVVHRSPKTGEPNKKDWFRAIEDATQKFEKCFDTSFYSKVASNVHENLTKFLDGSFNFNPDPDSTIKTRKSKNSVVINTAEGFPILLAYEQYSRNTYEGFMPRTIAPKHKWKWDNLENDKFWNHDQIKKDTHANNCIITLVSSLDIWTQLCMRRKFENKFNITPVEKKTEKQNVISKELKEILESREIPGTNSQITKHLNSNIPITNEQDFPSSLGLVPSTPKFKVKPAILSGEWVRPRCYVCCACGAQSRDSRALSLHVSSKHPHAQVQHYEIVGESLLKAGILKHLYVPPNQNMNRTRPPRGFRDCTKCMKSITIEDLHQHMLDCAGDTPTVRRKCRYRPFGMRKRRPRLPDNRIRKKMRNDIRARPTRQKNRMRPKPKNRSEVGDAETIRKMLADLPAKRHRVLVTPLNSILRPRRKIDKQRAMLMLKRHTYDDPKVCKQKSSRKSLHYDHQQMSTNIDRYKGMPTRDDDDNKPLKSRLKRVACKITRQTEALNRKAILKKPIRKICPFEKEENDTLEQQPDTPESPPIEVQIDELPLDQNEKRITLNENPENIREHSSGQGDGNNGQRDNQGPDGNGDIGNSRNGYAPPQNVPLKHSIARLTANSETHDKSVQFHHLFLVQQECNNTNEHVPTGQRVLFENEAVVTKLDKPPLHFNQNSSLVLDQVHSAEPVQEHHSESIQGQSIESIQKNKSNKPRKGLNDCIAMLKNKLVDTDPNAPAHVSVQCGSDEPLSPDPVLMSAPTLINTRGDVVMKPPQTCPSYQGFKKPAAKSVVRIEQLPKPSPLYRGQYFNHDIYSHERPTTQWRPVSYDAIMPRFIDNRVRKDISRRRSTSQHDNVFFTPQLLSVTPPNDDIMMKLSSDSYNAYNLPPRKSPKYCPDQFNVDGNKILGKFGKRTGFDKATPVGSNISLQLCGNIVNNHIDKNRKPTEIGKKSTRTRTSAPRKAVDTSEKRIYIHKDMPRNTRDSTEKYRKKVLDCEPQRDFTFKDSREKKSENYSQIGNRKRTSNLNADVNLSLFKPVDQFQLKADNNPKMPVQVYPEHKLSENQKSIPLAHASTNIQSIISLPLDLSSKALPVDPKYSSRHDTVLIANYDRCGTLDLSNKQRTSAEQFNEDEVVDLRVKHNSQYSYHATVNQLSSTNSQQELSKVTALNLVQRNKCVPTDLSLKRKNEDTNICINLSQKINLNEPQAQDLSKNKTKIIAPEHLPSEPNDNELPTDLTNKNVIDIEHTLMMKENVKNDANHTLPNKNLANCNDLNDQIEPSDLSGKNYDTSVTKEDNSVSIIPTPDNIIAPESTKTKSNENINYELESHVTPETSISYNTSSHIPKPKYEPTLRIPQYKIRPTGSDNGENNVTVTVSLPISIGVEIYSPSQISTNSTHHPSSMAHNSTMINNSMIASIEAQERITYSFTKCILNTAVTSGAGPMPVYPLSHREITTPLTTLESTRPIYSLPNACISMAKIDVTANSLLSIPSTTIMSTNPVYTLAGSSIATPLNCVTLPSTGHSIPYPPPGGTHLPRINSQKGAHYTSRRSAVTTRRIRHNVMGGPNSRFERDLQLARQLIMLPRDILAILHLISNERGDQLLDVLLRYLAAPRPTPMLSTQPLVLQIAGPSTVSLPTIPPKEPAVDASTDTVDIKPECPVQIVQNESQVQNNVNPSGTASNCSEQQAEKIEVQNQVIDLTHDEVVPKAHIDAEVNDEQVLLKEDIPPSIASTSNTQKTNNDNTASLRAVRIKAPSERQKLKIITETLETLPCPDIPVPLNTDDYDIELFQLDPALALNIQMYEVSSTQSNRNRMFNKDMILTDISITHLQPMADNVIQSRENLVVGEQNQNLQPQLLIQSQPGTSLDNRPNSNETKDPSAIPENINLNNINDNSSDVVSQLKKVNEHTVTVTLPNVQDSTSANLNQLEEDDDSDDDVSLAVIVKQKQQRQNKIKALSQLDTLKGDTSIIEKCKIIDTLSNQHIKQADKKTPPEGLIVIGAQETNILKTDANKTNQNNTEPTMSTIKQQNIQDIVTDQKSKQLKKKGKKGCSDASPLKDIKDKDKKEITLTGIKTVINKESDNIFETVNSNESPLKLQAKDNFHGVEIIQQKSTEVIQIQENMETTQNDYVKCVKEVNKKTKDIRDEEIVPNILTVDRKEKTGNYVNQKLENLNQNETVDNYGSEVIGESVVKEIEACDMNKIDTDKSFKYDDNSLIINNMPVSYAVLNTSNEDEDALPLRRSGRGKSLVMEGNEQNLIYNDTLTGQKAPLTKKQLIFSKLLLDEENNLKNSSAPVNDNPSLPEETKSCELTKTEIDFSKEKCKTGKRKKSPQPKKKYKKKRSIEISQHKLFYDDVPKTLIKDISSPESYDENKVNTLASYGEPNPEIRCETKLDTQNSNEQASNSVKITVDQHKKSVSGSSIKRKINPSVNDHQEQDYSGSNSKSKKSKLINENDLLDTQISEKIATDNSIPSTSHNLPLAARRVRSKSVVVKSSGSVLYDPYDIDFEDMGDKTEPFRKQKLTSLRTDNFMLSKEIDLQACATPKSVTDTISEKDLNCAAESIKDFKEAISDSDESTKSDVPLMKYVEEKERKNALLCVTSNNTRAMHITEEDATNEINVKQARKKHRKNKRSHAAIGNVQKENKDNQEVSEEQLRSEQFMESFGFFSERKPRKSNLLATKKISETFHIIGNDSDDAYLDSKERPHKKSSRAENKKPVEEEYDEKYYKTQTPTKLSPKYDKTLKLRSATLYCHICKKEFRRSDNLVRHQMSLLHASKLSESALNIRTAPVTESYNYLVVFKQHIDRLRFLEHTMKSKKQGKGKFTFPSLQQVLIDVHKDVREQQLARRNLSRDQALFLDCCELLKDSNRGQIEDRSTSRPFLACCPSSHALANTDTKEYDPNSGLSLQFSRYGKCAPSKSTLAKKPIIHTSARLSGMADFVVFSSSKQTNNTDLLSQPSTSSAGFAESLNSYTEVSKPKMIKDYDPKSDGELDLITAQNILESEEVRNLEKDLISGLKGASKFQPLLSEDKITPQNEHDDSLTKKSCNDASASPDIVISTKKENVSKAKNPPESKEKKNLDFSIENIDIFEDKFDKIKRKCRSQAAAAKHIQPPVETITSHKRRKKSEKKKGKKRSKKYNRNTVLTKGALKGYDSIKVSILTSDIDMSAIVPPIVNSSKKKKKRSSKKRRDRKKSTLNRKLDPTNNKETSQKNIDVYEFLDNEEPEIFELRPSTVMERFRNLNKKDMQSSTKPTTNCEEVESRDSHSDEDDFVYMSDDYVCSDEETENSLLSCELGNVKGNNDVKKSFSPLKRKDVMEKNAVMGKIFKHNAVRSEKKSIKPKETIKPTANLDQLFDSLLEEEPNSSALMNDTESPKGDSCEQKKRVFSPIVLSKYDLKSNKSDDFPSKKNRIPSPALSSDSAVSRRLSPFSSPQSSPRLSSSRYDISSPFEYEPSTSKRYDDTKKYDIISKDYQEALTKKYDFISEKKYDMPVPNNTKIDDDLILLPKRDKYSYDTYNKTTKDKTISRKKEKASGYRSSYDFKADYYNDDILSDDAGVARQRARRKCTVGKQNILAETWSSESELDSVPPRPNSAESVVLNVARKKKGRKREGQICGGRKGNKHVPVKKQDIESRVTSNNRNTSTSSGGSGTSRSGGSSAYTQHLSLPGPSGIGPRLRPTTSFWTDGDEEPEHVQQHGWIVGDSHKKLVTMLAHAKGRKRNNDEKLSSME